MIKVETIEDLGKFLIKEDIYSNNDLLTELYIEGSYTPLLSYIYSKYDLSSVLSHISIKDEMISKDFNISFNEYMIDILIDENKKINTIYSLVDYFEKESNLEIDINLTNLYKKSNNLDILISISIDDLLNIQDDTLVKIEDVIFVTMKKEHYVVKNNDLEQVIILWDTNHLKIYDKKINTRRNGKYTK